MIISKQIFVYTTSSIVSSIGYISHKKVFALATTYFSTIFTKNKYSKTTIINKNDNVDLHSLNTGE